ncbi:MAG: cupin domain-containing protein [Chloroflexota bacterium]|nr:cupin domain-containing protein [Chloroflexota bacterium]
MSESRPIVVHAEEAVAGPTTPGMELRQHLDPDGRWVGWSGWIRNEAGDVSGWHHHAANDTYVYVIRGSVTIEFGQGGAERVEARTGDFFLVPSQTVHRETTGPDGNEAFVLRVGGEPEHVNVDGPEGAGR